MCKIVLKMKNLRACEFVALEQIELVIFQLFLEYFHNI